MTFEQALKEIRQYYPIRRRVTDVAEIQVPKLLTPFNFFFVALVDFNGTPLLTDIATTVESFPDSTEKEWIALCDKHHVSWVDWHIECKYEGIQSLQNFLNVLDEASETMQNRR